MLLDLSTLAGGRLRETFRIGPGHDVFDGYDAEVEEPLSVEVDLTNPSAGTYVADVVLRGKVQEPCRRCLKPTVVEVDHRFRVIYQEGDAGEVGGDDDIVRIDRNEAEIDIGPVVRERLFVETERFPVCREGCAGLCSVCGRDLNEGSCECPDETSDSRWAKLEELLQGSPE